MTSSAITPEVVGLDTTELLIDTDLTPSELARVQSLETKLRQSDASVLEQYNIQGETLFKIQQEKLFRSREPGERFTWEQYLEKFTPALTKHGKGYGIEAARCRQLFYLISTGQIVDQGRPGQATPAPLGLEQVKPLLAKAPLRGPAAGGGFDMTGDWSAVLAIWEGAHADKAMPSKTDVSIARSQYEAKQLAAGRDPGRRPSEAQKAALEKANAARTGSPQEPTPDYSPKPEPKPEQPQATGSDPTIAAWEIQKDDSSVDAGAECKRITQALTEAHKAVSLLHGMLYSKINTYGRDYLGFLRQVDAGVYSLNNIDEQVDVLLSNMAEVSELLTADVGEGELSQRTVQTTASTFPTRA